MSRPWSCPVHGPRARWRWRNNGTYRGTPKRARTCVECHPERGPSLQGKSACPRCGSRRIVRVAGGRPGQPPYRGCGDCKAARQVRYLARAGLRPVLDYALGEDPALAIAEAIESAQERRKRA